jgi:hypothetical protein
MKRATMFKALVITAFVLPAIACSGPAIDMRAAGTDAIGRLLELPIRQAAS